MSALKAEPVDEALDYLASTMASSRTSSIPGLKSPSYMATFDDQSSATSQPQSMSSVPLHETVTVQGFPEMSPQMLTHSLDHSLTSNPSRSSDGRLGTTLVKEARTLANCEMMDKISTPTPTSTSFVANHSTIDDPKRRRIRQVMPLTTCQLCNLTFRYQRPHFLKFHPEMVNQDGHIIDTNVNRARNPEDSISQSSRRHSNDVEEWNGPVRFILEQQRLIKLGFGGVPAGRFCARCGLVVDDWQSHQKTAHDLDCHDDQAPQSDSKETAKCIRRDDRGSEARLTQKNMFSADHVLVSKPIAMTTSEPASRHTSHSLMRKHTLFLGTRRQTPEYATMQQTPRSTKALPGLARVANVNAADEEPYEKLLRTIRNIPELSENQKADLIFDLLKQQIKLLQQPLSAASVSSDCPSRASRILEPSLDDSYDMISEHNGSSYRSTPIEASLRPLEDLSVENLGAERFDPPIQRRNMRERDADADDLYS